MEVQGTLLEMENTERIESSYFLANKVVNKFAFK